ncbi:flippase [Paraburkholderia sp. SARCC-3016]|jgi:PST family polysaccharide transporter|uniref:flippase n=1 Tax=Paraburkholderia sp. SARCC-3016 TaxID=3058611 RepID=UPI002807572C|nr:flippase [Paraburkholderia sp. SARCC-3016]MDQ7980501.1 flippase [Paraburkholderia sp. SARCC-3016]
MSDATRSAGRAGNAAAHSGARVSRNVAIMIVSFAVNYLASFATFPYLTRMLGPEKFGVLAYGMALAAYGTLLTEWGFGLTGPKAVVERVGRTAALNELIWSVTTAKACLCLVSFAALALLFAFTPHDPTSRDVILLSWLGVFGNVFTLYWFFQGTERFGLIAAMVAINRGVTLPLTFWLVHGPQDVALAAAIQAAGPVVAALLSVVIAWRFGVLRAPQSSWGAVRRQIAEAADAFVANASVSLFGAANTILLKSSAGVYQAGLYAAADKLRTVGNLVPAQLCAVLYPRIAALFARDRASAARLTVLGAVITLAISALCAALFIGWAEPLAHFVLGGEFSGAAPVLALLCGSMVFGNLAYFLGLQVLLPFGAGRSRSRLILATGLLNVAVAFALVPRHGAQGAAAAFLLAQAVLLALYLWSIFADSQRRVYLTGWWRHR